MSQLVHDSALNWISSIFFTSHIVPSQASSSSKQDLFVEWHIAVIVIFSVAASESYVVGKNHNADNVPLAEGSRSQESGKHEELKMLVIHDRDDGGNLPRFDQ